VSDAAGLARLPLEGAAAVLRDAAVALVDALARLPQRTLVGWLDALAAALDAAGSLARLRSDVAGRQALSALGIEPPLGAARRSQLAAALEPMPLTEFTRWVDDVLERETFLPPDARADEPSPPPLEMVITPLAGAMLRPFAAAVLPGADDRRLGAPQVVDSLLPRSVAEVLGLADVVGRRDAELLAFAQLLRLPRVTLLRRRADGADPLADSPFVDRLGLALAERGSALRAWRDPRIARHVVPTPIGRSAPTVSAERLPRRVSASTFEALRDCPYRFFAQSILGVRAVDELDDEVEKRDYGQWLHEVLHEFHLGRANGASVDDDCARLRAIGAGSLAAQGLDAAAFLPFSASFEVLVPRYVAWLHEREAAGAAWSQGEVELRAAPEALGGVELQGRIDRIDVVDGGARLELIDYKTGSSSRLKEIVRDRPEDTQLAFYAALVRAQGELPLRAFYLAMDSTKGLETHEHAEVTATASLLVKGLAEDLRRLRQGAAMPPLGEGSACEHCDARGLCRRDHWSPEALPLQAEADRG
jgi:ATP-dependent helicase/nuclease subunit B